MATLVIFGFVAIPFHAVWYHKLVDALYVSIETRRRRTSASERRDRELKRARRKAKVKLDLAPDAIRKAWTYGSSSPRSFCAQKLRAGLTWATHRVN